MLSACVVMLSHLRRLGYGQVGLNNILGLFILYLSRFGSVRGDGRRADEVTRAHETEAC